MGLKLLAKVGVAGALLLGYFGYEARRTYFFGRVISLENHHELKRNGKLNQEKEIQLEERLREYIQSKKDVSVEEAIDFSLDFTADNLEFRFLSYALGERGKGYFRFPYGVKKTDCVDYAFLFDRTFDYVAPRVGINAESVIMRSENAFLFEYNIDNHDWNLVREQEDTKRYFVDPTAHDYFMPGDIKPIVVLKE